MISIKNKELPGRLKFRFFHKPTQKIIPGYGFNPYFVFGDVTDGIGTEYNPAKFEDCVIMQNTGFMISTKDKYMKAILSVILAIVIIVQMDIISVKIAIAGKFIKSTGKNCQAVLNTVLLMKMKKIMI